MILSWAFRYGVFASDSKCAVLTATSHNSCMDSMSMRPPKKCMDNSTPDSRRAFTMTRECKALSHNMNNDALLCNAGFVL